MGKALAILCLIGGVALAGPQVVQPPLEVGVPEVTASASPTVLHLGNRFTLFVTAAFDPGVEVNLREPLELGPAFEVRRKMSRDDVRADGKRVREWQIDVLVWELGDLHVPPVAVTFTLGGKAGQVETNPVPLRVEATLADTDDPKAMRGLAPPTDLTSRDLFWAILVAAIGAVVGGAVALYIWRRGRNRHVALTGGLPMSRRLDTPGERALERLMVIEKSGMLARDGERRAGYRAMVDVIREYVGSRYHVATRDLTTLELLRKLDGVAPPDERAAIEGWLETCDVVKYGGLLAGASDATKVLGDARALVVATTGSRVEAAA